MAVLPMCLALSLVGVGAPDDASPGAVGLAPVELHEGAPPGTASEVRSRIEETLQTGRFELSLLEGDCRDTNCWSSRARDAGAAYVVRARVEKSGSDQKVILQVVDASDGSVVSVAEKVCDLCGRSELADLAADLTARVTRRLDQLAGEPGTLVITSDPSGATVSIDGEAVGQTPLEHQVRPGEHTMELTLEGHVASRRTMTVEGGVRDQVAVSLEAAAVPRPSVTPDTSPSAPTGPSDRVFVISGAALLGAGLAGIGVGAALVAIHADPIDGDCSGDNVDPDGDCRYLRDTRTGGAVALAAGAAGAIAGAVLLGIGLKRRQSRVRANASFRSAGLTVRF